jgi:large subunit ribosomal protein L22
MEVKSVQKFVRTSPRKLRLVADMIRVVSPSQAIEILPHVQKRAAEPLLKVVKSAIANAKQQGYLSDTLIFKEIQINAGPTLKRGMPVSRGRWHPIKKRTSHIRVVLEVSEKNQPNSAEKNPKSAEKAKPMNKPTQKVTGKKTILKKVESKERIKK